MNIRKKTERINKLKAELEQNHKIYDFNIEILSRREELHKANLESLNLNEQKYNINKKMLEIEIRKNDTISAIFQFHNDLEWINLSKEAKEFNLKETEREWEARQREFNTQTERINAFRFAGINTTEEKIYEQQKRIEERNPQIAEELKKLGADFNAVLAKEIKQDYIG